MKLIIVGSGGNTPTPRISCTCEVCTKARTIGPPFKRNLSALYIEDTKTLIDCPEDINDSLNNQKIIEIDNLFITHWHPDHSFGFRLIVQANYDFILDKCNKKIKIYIPEKVLEEFEKQYPALNYFINVKKMADLIIIKADEEIKINNIIIQAKEHYEDSTHYAYLIKNNKKRILYAPCDTIDLKQNFVNLDLLIHEQGYFSPELTWELSFEKLIERLKIWKPKEILLTHIPEDELKRYGWNMLAEKELEAKKHKISLNFAYDGQIINL